MLKKLFIFSTLFFVMFTGISFADLGVGVGVGKIHVDELLKPGEIYTLPPITVLNTGDEPSDYQVVIQHQEKQPQIIPQDGWFTFSPKTFHLDPKKVQTVKITLNLPIRTVPGDYFAYLEAQPVKKDATGVTSVNIAAATKLYFTVVPGSVLSGIYYKILSIWNMTYPLPEIIFIGIVGIICLVVLRKFINIEIKFSKSHVPTWVITVILLTFLILYLLFWMKFFHKI